MRHEKLLYQSSCLATRCLVIDMHSKYDRQAAVVDGDKSKKIIEIVKYHKTIIYDIANVYGALDNKDNFSPECKTHKKRSITTRTPVFVAEHCECCQHKHDKNGQRNGHKQANSRPYCQR